jgi:hypothetical protein
MPDEQYMSDDELLEQARRCYKIVSDTEYQQRQREREDLLFQMAENQWSDVAKRERSGGMQGGVMTPARPMLSISLLKQPMQLVYNQFTRARLGVNLHPVSEDANKELAETKQGLYRRIERDGGAEAARGWAFMRALVAGRGAYRVNKKYDEDSPPDSVASWDQEIVFQRILYQENVYMDPAAQEPDYSDAAWAFVISWMTKADFRKAFPKSKAAAATSSFEWEGLENEAPGWVKAAAGDNDEQGVLVAEYWYRHVRREVIVDPANPERKREREAVSVYCYKINGVEVLERQEWDGKYIPIVIVSAEELIPVDGQRRWQGMVRPARDAQMAYNYSISSAIEDISRLSKAPYVGAEGQFEGHEEKWNQANVRNFPYLEYKPTTIGDKPAPPPQPMQIDGTKLQLSLAMSEQARGMVQAATSVHEPSLGEMPTKRESQSGRAILALQQQSDAGTSQFIQGLVVALRHEARIVLDLMPHVYDRPGRQTALVMGEDETETVMLGTPFVTDPESGRPTPADPRDPRAKTVDLSKGKYGVSIDIGRSFQTRLQEGGEMLGEVIAKAPALMPLIGPTYFEFQDWPGAKEVAEILRKVRDQQYPGLAEGDDKNSPQALQAQNQALQGQLQQLQQQFQQAVQALQTDQAKQMAQVEVVKIKAQVDMELARMKHAADITVARIKAEQQAVSDATEAKEEMLATGIKIEAEREARHEEMAHDRAMAQAQGRSTTVSRSTGRDDEREASREQSDGGSAERTEEDQPPQQAGA